MDTSPAKRRADVDQARISRRVVLGATAIGTLGITTHVLPAAAQSASPAGPAPSTYEAGDVGPGGGLIFLTPDDPAGDGVHYYEAAPTDYDATNQNWLRIGGSASASIATSTGIHTGPANTAEMLRLGDDDRLYASHKADLYTSAGLNDWFLPSSGELAIMWATLGSGLGLVSNATYWSSSQADSDEAFALMSGSRTIGRSFKSGGARVRAVRRFAA